MPLTSKGEEIKANMEKEYGAKKGESVFYASRNKGTISGVDSARGRRRNAAFRDAIKKGMSLDKALAFAKDEGGGSGEPIEGAKEVFNSVSEFGHKLVEGGGEKGGEGKTYDAIRRFRAAVRDAVRENQPLPKIIELGVLSGTEHKQATPESEGKEYKTIDAKAFFREFRGAVAKGASTTDAIRKALGRR